MRTLHGQGAGKLGTLSTLLIVPKVLRFFLIDLGLVLFFSSLVFRQVYEDNDHGLYTVTLFKKVVDEFKLHARDKKYNSLVDDYHT